MFPKFGCVSAAVYDGSIDRTGERYDRTGERYDRTGERYDRTGERYDMRLKCSCSAFIWYVNGKITFLFLTKILIAL